jgi:carbonic anhydrase/acetyltransferase-like protein (isoleucine patch superfamily)
LHRGGTLAVMKSTFKHGLAGPALRLGMTPHRLQRADAARSDAAAASAQRDPSSDRRIFALDAARPRLGPLCYVADGACLVGDVVLAEHASVWFCAVVRGDNGSIRVGAQSNVQDGAVVHCLPHGEVVVGTQVSIGHLATIHGASIGDRCLIGMGAVVMDGVRIGDDTLVAAGSIVTGGRHFDPGILLRGSPARPVRALMDHERTMIRANALHYVSQAERFRRSLQRL